MEQIEHKHVEVSGLKLHVAELGTGPKAVLFLHGFPEIWYSWRHQMVAAAAAGYRAIAFDFRGYGLSQHPPEPEKASFYDLVADVVGVMDSLGINKEPGRAEADFGRFDVKTVIRNIYLLFCGSELQVASDEQEIMDLADPFAPLPPWFTEEDLNVYSSLYENSGFWTALHFPYRTVPQDYGLKDPKITAPGMLIMGENDYVLKFPGMEEYIKSERVKEFMPNLEIIFHEEGNHFIQEQLPEEVNQLLTTFLNKHST